MATSTSKYQQIVELVFQLKDQTVGLGKSSKELNALATQMEKFRTSAGLVDSKRWRDIKNELQQLKPEQLGKLQTELSKITKGSEVAASSVETFFNLLQTVGIAAVAPAIKANVDGLEQLEEKITKTEKAVKKTGAEFRTVGATLTKSKEDAVKFGLSLATVGDRFVEIKGKTADVFDLNAVGQGVKGTSSLLSTLTGTLEKTANRIKYLQKALKIATPEQAEQIQAQITTLEQLKQTGEHLLPGVRDLNNALIARQKVLERGSAVHTQLISGLEKEQQAYSDISKITRTLGGQKAALGIAFETKGNISAALDRYSTSVSTVKTATEQALSVVQRFIKQLGGLEDVIPENVFKKLLTSLTRLEDNLKKRLTMVQNHTQAINTSFEQLGKEAAGEVLFKGFAAKLSSVNSGVELLTKNFQEGAVKAGEVAGTISGLQAKLTSLQTAVTEKKDLLDTQQFTEITDGIETAREQMVQLGKTAEANATTIGLKKSGESLRELNQSYTQLSSNVQSIADKAFERGDLGRRLNTTLGRDALVDLVQNLQQAQAQFKALEKEVIKSEKAFEKLGVPSEVISQGFKTVRVDAGKAVVDISTGITSIKQRIKELGPLGEHLIPLGIHSTLREITEEGAGVYRGVARIFAYMSGIGPAFVEQGQIAVGAIRNLEEALVRFRSGAVTWSLGLLMLGTAVAAPFVAAIRTFAEFTDIMGIVRGVTGATEEEFQKLTQAALDMGRTTRFTATDAARALEYLGKAGFTAVQAIQALPTTLNLAQAAAIDLGRAAEIVTNIMTGFDLSVEKLPFAADVLTLAVNKSNAGMEDLGYGFAYVGALSKGLGADFNDLTGALALLHNVGLKGTLAATSLRGALDAMFNPTKDEAELMGRLSQRIGSAGLQLKDSQGNFIGFVKIVQQLENAGFTADEALRLFGQRAGPGMAGLLRIGSEKLRQFKIDLDGAAGITSKMADVMDQTLLGRFKAFLSALEGLGDVVASTLEPAIKGILNTFTNLINTTTRVYESLGWVGDILGFVAAAIAGLLASIGSLTFAWILMISPLRQFKALFGTILKALVTYIEKAAIASKTTAGVATAIGGVVGATKELKTAGGVFKIVATEMSKDGGIIVETLENVAGGAAGAAIGAGIGKAGKEAGEEAAKQTAKGFGAAFKEAFAAIVGTIVGVTWKDVFHGLRVILVNAFKATIEWIKKIGIVGIARAIGGLFKNPFVVIGTTIVGALWVLPKTLSEVTVETKKQLDALQRSFSNFRSSYKTYIDGVNEISDSLKLGIQIPDQATFLKGFEQGAEDLARTLVDLSKSLDNKLLVTTLRNNLNEITSITVRYGDQFESSVEVYNKGFGEIGKDFEAETIKEKMKVIIDEVQRLLEIKTNNTISTYLRAVTDDLTDTFTEISQLEKQKKTLEEFFAGPGKFASPVSTQLQQMTAYEDLLTTARKKNNETLQSMFDTLKLSNLSEEKRLKILYEMDARLSQNRNTTEQIASVHQRINNLLTDQQAGIKGGNLRELATSIIQAREALRIGGEELKKQFDEINKKLEESFKVPKEVYDIGIEYLKDQLDQELTEIEQSVEYRQALYERDAANRQVTLLDLTQFVIEKYERQEAAIKKFTDEALSQSKKWIEQHTKLLGGEKFLFASEEELKIEQKNVTQTRDIYIKSIAEIESAKVLLQSEIAELSRSFTDSLRNADDVLRRIRARAAGIDVSGVRYEIREINAKLSEAFMANVRGATDLAKTLAEDALQKIDALASSDKAKGYMGTLITYGNRAKSTLQEIARTATKAKEDQLKKLSDVAEKFSNSLKETNEHLEKLTVALQNLAGQKGVQEGHISEFKEFSKQVGLTADEIARADSALAAFQHRQKLQTLGSDIEAGLGKDQKVNPVTPDTIANAEKLDTVFNRLKETVSIFAKNQGVINDLGLDAQAKGANLVVNALLALQRTATNFAQQTGTISIFDDNLMQQVEQLKLQLSTGNFSAVLNTGRAVQEQLQQSFGALVQGVIQSNIQMAQAFAGAQGGVVGVSRDLEKLGAQTGKIRDTLRRVTFSRDNTREIGVSAEQLKEAANASNLLGTSLKEIDRVLPNIQDKVNPFKEFDTTNAEKVKTLFGDLVKGVQAASATLRELLPPEQYRQYLNYVDTLQKLESIDWNKVDPKAPAASQVKLLGDFVRESNNLNLVLKQLSNAKGVDFEQDVEKNKKLVGDLYSTADDLSKLLTSLRMQGLDPNAEAVQSVNAVIERVRILQDLLDRLKIPVPGNIPATTPGGHTGGVVPGFAAGGLFNRPNYNLVPGTGSGDHIPALLEPGEFILRKSVVERLGLPFLNLLNRGILRLYALGGMVNSIPSTLNSAFSNLQHTPPSLHYFQQGGLVAAGAGGHDVVDVWLRIGSDPKPYVVQSSRDQVRGLVGALKQLQRGMKRS